MPKEESVKQSEPMRTVNGRISDIFAHRFVLDTAKGKVLADVGKHNQDSVALQVGDEVEATGEMKPSELKIRTLLVNGQMVKLEEKHKYKDQNRDDEQTSRYVRDIAKSHNLMILGELRKAKHVEILGKTPDNELVEMHIEHDGTVRKTEMVAPDSEKWSDELEAA